MSVLLRSSRAGQKLNCGGMVLLLQEAQQALRCHLVGLFPGWVQADHLAVDLRLQPATGLFRAFAAGGISIEEQQETALRAGGLRKQLLLRFRQPSLESSRQLIPGLFEQLALGF